MRHDRKGLIIFTALIIAAALSIMVGAYSTSIMYRNNIYMRYLNSIKAYYLATSGISYARPLVYYGDNGWEMYDAPGFSLTESGNTVDLKFDITGDTMTIRSTATVAGVIRTVTCELEAFPGDTYSGGVIIGWKRDIK